MNSGEIWIKSPEPEAPEGFLYVKFDNVYISDDELPSKRSWEVENDNTPPVNKIQSGHGSMFITRSDGIYALGNNYAIFKWRIQGNI